MPCQWKVNLLQTIAHQWLAGFHRNKSLLASEHSAWWSFVFNWPKQINLWLLEFTQGNYRFSPMRQYRFDNNTVRCWDYQDRLMIKLILHLIKATFKNILSQRCFHIEGISGARRAIRHIRHVMQAKPFTYVIRTDIKGYYASISRKILMQQLLQQFDDPRLHFYFEQIVNFAVDYHGDVHIPEKGIPRRSSLSPFFGALYLKPLDDAFSTLRGIQYFRFMDDILILAQSKRQYRRAKKRLHDVLDKLELSLSPSKTRMGSIQNGFHFLGVDFHVPRSREGKTQVEAHIHDRSCARALAKVNALQENVVHPAKIQRYLRNWASWWANTIQSKGTVALLVKWVSYTKSRDPAVVWLARGLIPQSSRDST